VPPREPPDDLLGAREVPPAHADPAEAGGDPLNALLAAVLLPSIAERTVSPAEVEADGGLTTEEIQEVYVAFGLPAPPADSPSLTPAEAEAFKTLARYHEAWPRDLRLRIARVYGRLLARIAQTELALFREHTARLEHDENRDHYALLRDLQEAFEGLRPVAEQMLLGVHERWLEHELAQAAVTGMEQVADAHLPGAVDVTFLFCDLKDFTLYANTEGDAAAVAAIDRFNDVVTAERGSRMRFMKLLGDGVMLVYPDAAEAVAAGARIIAAMRAGGPPGVHASAHRGFAIPREGDWFGGAVNLTARLLDSAGLDELVATRAVVETAGPEFAWELAGRRRVRGFSELVDVYRLAAASNATARASAGGASAP
jgi:class 3 adenylate cyclase